MGSLVSDYSISDINFDSVMLSLDKSYKSFKALTLTNVTSNVVPAIAAGSWAENNGALYKFDTEEAISTTDPVTTAAVADGKIWIYLTPEAGTASGATTDATGYVIGSTVITLASAGTGTILVGDLVKFAGDDHTYTVTSGDADVSNGGSITIDAPGLYEAIPSSATAITITAGSITAAFSATAPTFSDSKQGWYGTGGQANYRCIGRVVKQDVSYEILWTGKQVLNNETSDFKTPFQVDKVWSFQQRSEEETLASVCWSPELNLFCAVHVQGTNRVMTSPDGITWTNRIASVLNSWQSVCWSPELSLFCAVSASGTGDRVMTSPDGTTWTTRVNSVDNNWQSVCWSPELSLFCAVSNTGTGDRVMTSPNGTTWTTRTSSEDSGWAEVIWSSELNLFCAVATTGTNRVMTSPDGTTWTSRIEGSAQWGGIVWSPELSLFCIFSTDSVSTSPDGTTWTSRTSPTGTWGGSAWSPELSLFCVAGQGTGYNIMTSPDGISWSIRHEARSQQSTQSWLACVWSPELSLFCAVGSGIQTSSYGVI